MSSERFQIGSSTGAVPGCDDNFWNELIITEFKERCGSPRRSMAKSEVRFEHGKILLQIEAIEWPPPTWCQKMGRCLPKLGDDEMPLTALSVGDPIGACHM